MVASVEAEEVVAEVEVLQEEADSEVVHHVEDHVEHQEADSDATPARNKNINKTDLEMMVCN